MKLTEKYKFNTLNQLLDKLEGLIKENIEHVKKRNLA